MERIIQYFRQTIASARPWVIAAVIVAAGLSLYLAAQGGRYWIAAGNNAAVREEISRLEQSIGQLPDGSAQQEARLEVKEDRLESVRRLFDYPATDTLMSIVSEIAGDAGLNLVSMTAEKVTVEPRGTLQYQVRPIAVVIDGPTANVQEFLALLYDRVPVVTASDAKIVNLDTDPSTQLQLRFFLSPEPVPKEEPEGEEEENENPG